MPSIFSRIGSLVPSYPAGGIRPAPAPAPTRRERPEVNSEKVASTIAAAVGGRTWFLPYGDATSTNDSPEIRAAMRMMLRDPYVKTAWLSQVLNVLSMDFQVHHAQAKTSKKAQDSVNFTKHAIENSDGGMVGVGSAIIANLGSDGHTFGEKVGQIETRGKYSGRWSLKALKAIDPEDVRIIGDEFNNVTGLTVTRTNETFPISDFTYARYFPLFNEPLGMAAFRASYGCYDDQTEILTRSGWKLFADLTDSDEVATLEPESGRMMYEVPKERRSFPYKGKMFCQRSKFIDVRVTPNHRMWIGSHTHNKFRIVEARELMDGSIGRVVKYKRDAIWEGDERATFTLPEYTHQQGTGTAGELRERTIPAKELPMDDWLRFLGLWLADGCAWRDKARSRQSWVVITQNPGDVLDGIIEVVKRLGFAFDVRPPRGDRSAADLRISSVQLWAYLDQLGKSHTKFIPDEFKALSSRQLSILLEWMLKGDGRHDFGEGPTQYCTVSKRLADDTCELALKTGKAANLYAETMAGPSAGETIWIVGLNTAGISGTVVNRSIDGRSWEEYDGLVSCVTTTNGIVYVRRNGKACWCGNSYWMRDTVRKLRAIHHEKHAGGVWLGTYTDPADKGPLESALQRVRSAMWASIPEGVRMEVVQRTTASEADWKSFDESLREEILIGIALAHLHILQGGVSDARGDTKVHKEVSDLGPWYLTYLVQQVINRQIIPDLIDYNFADLDEYPRITLGGVTNQEILELFQIIETGQRVGFNPSRSHYAEATTIQEADPNDPNDRLAPPQQTDPFGGMGMGGMGGGGGGDPFGGGSPAALPPFDPNAGGGLEGFAEGRLPFEAFAFAPAKTRKGTIKAVGTGEHQGRVYYGKRAERVLRGTQRQQADPPDDPLPTVDQGTIDRAASGDGAARRDVAEHAADMIEAGTKGLGGNRPLPPEAKQKLAAPLAKQVNYGGQLSPEIAQKTAGFVLGLMDGETPGSMARDAASLGVSGASTVGSKVRQFVGWAARQGAGVGLAVVKGLARAAWWLTKKAGGFLLRTSGRAVMGVLDYPIGVAKNVAQFAPFALRHLATIVGGAALLAASVAVPAALPLGVVGKLAIGIPAVAATSWTVYRRLPAVGRRLNAGAYDTATGMHSETTAAEFLRTVEAFAEWEEFAWEDWTQADGKWKSPGGRVLSDPVYQRLKAGKSSPAQRRAPAASTATTKAPPAAAPSQATERRALAALLTAAGSFEKPVSINQALESRQVPQSVKDEYLRATGQTKTALPPTGVASLRPSDIQADPARFQFKLGTDRVTGVGEELKSVTWNPELAGVIAVWRDPADGKTYVVNGHHRLELAKRSGAEEIDVRYLKAATAEEARAKGALINIAEGRGTAVDAAKFLRDTGRTPDDLSKVGISLKGAVARDAADLVRLDADLFRRVALGTIPVPLAIAAAKHLPDHTDQRQFVQRIEQQEDRTGRPVPLRIAEELAREMAIAPRVSTATQTLFGPADDESAWVQRAEIKSYVRNELAKEAKDFRLASSTRRAQALGAVAGNSLDVTANRRIADRSTALLDDFDAVAHLKGGVSDLLNSFAVEYANASPAARQAIRQRAVVAVRSALSGDDVRVVQRDGGRRPGLFDAPG